MSNPKPDTAKKRKAISIGEKLEIIRLIDEGQKQVNVANSKGLSTSTVQRIYSDREKIRSNYSKFNVTTKKARPSTFPTIDAALTSYFDLVRDHNVPLSGNLVAEKAKEIATKEGITDFKGTKNWVTGWKKRHSIKFYTVSGEAGSVDDEAVNNWLDNVWPGLRSKFKDEDIYNADESGLFFRQMPDKTLNRKGRRCTGGKLSKERLTFMLCVNATGTDKVKPVVIGKSENPRCFKNIKKNSLPVHYYHNGKAWMTRDIFEKWLKNFDLRMRFAKRKVLLLLDNCSAHRELKVKTPNVTLAYFPAGATSKIQPLDMGIINETKKLYRSAILRRILKELEASNFQSPPLAISVLDAIMMISKCWDLLKESIVVSSFKSSKLISDRTEETNEEELTAEEAEVTAEEEEVIEEEEEVTAEEEDLDLERLGLTPESLEDYFTVDSEVLTEDLPTVDSVLADMHAAAEASESEEDIESDEESNEGPQEIDFTAVSSSLQTIKLWLLSQKDGDSQFSAVHQLEGFLERSRLKKLRQSKITDFVPQ